MDDLLVIILTLVFAGIGALGQLKKKRQNPESKNETGETDNFWSFLDDKQPVPAEENVETLQQQSKIYRDEPGVDDELLTAKPHPEQPKPKHDFKSENKGASIYSNDLTTEQNVDVKQVKKKVRDFSLRKAVIYSEILNRKYD